MDRLSELIERCKKNDRKAQREIFEIYAAKMLAMCMRYCRNADDAQDMLQDGFIKVFENIGKFKSESSLDTWMSRIFINVSLNQYWKAHMKYNHVEFEGDKHDNTDRSEWDNDSDDVEEHEVEIVIEAIQSLPEIYRIIINLYAIDGLNHNQIAVALDISEGTSKSRLSRGRILLKEKLKRI